MSPNIQIPSVLIVKFIFLKMYPNNLELNLRLLFYPYFDTDNRKEAFEYKKKLQKKSCLLALKENESFGKSVLDWRIRALAGRTT